MPGDPSVEQWIIANREAERIVQSYRDQAPSGFDPQATMAAIGISVGVGALATGFGAYEAGQSAQQAAATNAQNVANTNALNQWLFNQSRGAGGNALLPMYAPGGTETQLFQNALASYAAEQNALGTPEQQAAAYQAITRGLQPSVAAGSTLVNQLFSGQLERQQEANIAPVLAARGQVAAAQKTGILEGLQQQLNALSANRARAGYAGGGSSFERNLLTGATIPALQAAGTVGAQASLQNASDIAALKNQDINTRLNNLSLPLTQAGNAIQMQNLPATAIGNTATQSMQPFNWFKLQPQAFQAQNLPLVQPIPNVGQIVGTGIGSGASTLGNYFAMQSLINQLSPNSQQNQLINKMNQQGYLGGGTSSNLFDPTTGLGVG